jgi:hypothetical protein
MSVEPNESEWVAAVRSAVPDGLVRAFDRAVAWRPRTAGWKYSLEKAMAAVRSGSKPLAYGGRGDVMEEAAARHGLKWDGTSAFLPENADLATLMSWAEGLEDKRIGHAVRGLALGYPVGSIRSFSDRYGMKVPLSPSRLSSCLRRIAAGVDASRNPDRAKVASALRSVLVAVDSMVNTAAAPQSPNYAQDVTEIVKAAMDFAAAAQAANDPDIVVALFEELFEKWLEVQKRIY